MYTLRVKSNNKNKKTTNPFFYIRLTSCLLKSRLRRINEFYLILDDDKIFFTGKNIFKEEESILEKFKNLLKNETEIDFISKPVELDEIFTKSDSYQQISAGTNHFAILTDTGTAYSWTPSEKKFKLNEKIKLLQCCRNFTVFVTENDEIHVLGKIKGVLCSESLKIFDPKIKDISSIHISRFEDIFIITSSGKVFKSQEFDQNENFSFDEIFLRNEEDKIIEISTGKSFTSFITDSGNFYTNFNEIDDSNKFEEISKFKHMNIIKTVSGLNHILVHAVPRQTKTLVENFTAESDSDENDNELNKTYTIFDTQKLKMSPIPKHHENKSDDDSKKDDSDFETYFDRSSIISFIPKSNLIVPKDSDTESNTEETVDKIIEEKDERIKVTKIFDMSSGEIYNCVKSKDGTEQIELMTSSSEEDSTAALDDILYIDNGVDVTDDVKKKGYQTKTVEEVEILKTAEKLEDTFLGEKLCSYKAAPIRDLRDETKLVLKEAYEEVITPIDARKIINSPSHLNPFEDSDDDRRTTASLVSDLPENPFDVSDEENEDTKSVIIKEVEAEANKENEKKPGKFKKFFQELKDSSCKTGFENMESKCKIFFFF